MTNSFEEFCANADMKSRHQQLLEIKQSEERKKLNKDFIQIYDNAMLLLSDVIAENKLAARIFCILSSHMPKNNIVSVNRDLLAKFFHVIPTMISKAIKFLIDCNLVKVFKQGRSNTYCINAAAAWTSDANSKQYAKFNSTIYLNPDLIKRLNILHETWVKVLSWYVDIGRNKINTGW